MRKNRIVCKIESYQIVLVIVFDNICSALKLVAIDIILVYILLLLISLFATILQLFVVLSRVENIFQFVFVIFERNNRFE